MIVIDASALVKALVEKSPSGDAARARLRGETLVAPSHIDAEVLSVLRGLHRAAKLSIDRAERAIALTSQLPMERAPLSRYLSRAWELRQNYSAYDALYVAVAESVDAPLVTADARMAGGGVARCVIEVVS